MSRRKHDKITELRRMSFSNKIRIQCLLWCDRHCCLCKRPCGVDIELHHITPIAESGTNELDNAIPLCFDCHAKVEHYNHRHPRGTKFRGEELKKRREQVYEEFTRHLVPPIDYRISQQIPHGEQRKLPDVGFIVRHLGDALPVRVFVRLHVIRGGKRKELSKSGYYGGTRPWRVNPRMMYFGHFDLPRPKPDKKERIEIEASVEIEDCYGRRHPQLPVGWVYKPEISDWYFEP